MSDVVKFLSGDKSKAEDTQQVGLESGQILFGLSRQVDGTLKGSIYYDYYDSKYNIIQRVNMGSAFASGSNTAGSIYISDKAGHLSDLVIIQDTTEATLLLPKIIYGDFFSADSSFEVKHSLLETGHSYLYGNGLLFVNTFNNDQEGWLRLASDIGSKKTVLELATRDSYSQDYQYNQIVARQYDAQGNIIKDKDNNLREVILLGTKGESWFPGKVTSARGFVGNLEGNATTATKATYDADGGDIQDKYVAIVKVAQSTGTIFNFRAEDAYGNYQNDIFIPLADNSKAGLVSNVTQALYGNKIFADGISFPSIATWPTPAGEAYPIKSQGLSWSGSSDNAKIYYEVQASDKGMLVVESGDDTNAGVIFRNASSGAKVEIINGNIYGTLKGTAEKTEQDIDGNKIEDHYFCYFTTESSASKFSFTGVPHSGTERDLHNNNPKQPIKVILPNATDTIAGLVTAEAQTFGGHKSFASGLSSSDNIYFANYSNNNNTTSGTSLRGVYGSVGDNDGWRIAGGSTASNAGFLEIATCDDGNEPIYVRQYYNGGGALGFTKVRRTLILLDQDGNTIIPGNLVVQGNLQDTTGNTMSLDMFIAKIKQKKSTASEFTFAGYNALGTELCAVTVPNATVNIAGLVTAVDQSFKGLKSFETGIILSGISSYIGQYYNKLNESNGAWYLQGKDDSDSVTLTTKSTLGDASYGAVYIEQKNKDNKSKKIELASSVGFTGLLNLNVDNGVAAKSDTIYSFRVGGTRPSYFNSTVDFGGTLYFGVEDVNNTAICYINGKDENKSNITKNTFYARLLSLYLDDDLYVGKGIEANGIVKFHKDAHLHNVFFYNEKEIGVGSVQFVRGSGTAVGTSTLTLGNDIVSGKNDNSQGFIKLYGSNATYAQIYYDNSYFRLDKDIYFTHHNTYTDGFANGIRGQVGTNDYWRVGGGATATNAGFAELATGDDGNEPIYVRQYTGVFSAIKRTATILDQSGNTTFPQALGINSARNSSNYGLSLYGGAQEGSPANGLIFRELVGDFHGYVEDLGTDWATFFLTSSAVAGEPTSKGWIFRDSFGFNAASINTEGYAQFNRISLNRTASDQYGRISWYSPKSYVWYDYMSTPTAGFSPTGDTPSKIGNINSWTKYSLIEQADGYGWIWESAINDENQVSTPWLGLSAYDGRLIMGGTEIYYKGTRSTSSMIKWLDNIDDDGGNGMTIGGGGLVIIGAGECAKELPKLENASKERLYLASDGDIFFLTKCNNINDRAGVWLNEERYFYPNIKNTGSLGTKTYYWNTAYSQWIHLNMNKSGKDGGITLYNADPTYGIMFRQTSQMGTHGTVTGDWSTYFTMSDNDNRGWIFRRKATNVASIDGLGNLNLNGNIYIPGSGTNITWKSGTIWQRLLIVDDSTADTDEFKFQHSSNKGATWLDTLKIRDNGTIELTSEQGMLYKSYSRSNQKPMIWMNGGDTDNYLFQISSGVSSRQYFGYGLKYIGSGSQVNNFLRLYADNQNKGSVIAFSINQNGQMGFGTDPKTDYQLTIMGNTYFGGLTKHKGDILPYATGSYNLGSTTLRWKSLFIGSKDTYGATYEPIYWKDGVPVGSGEDLRTFVRAIDPVPWSGLTWPIIADKLNVASTDNALVRWDGANGHVQNSNAILEDNGNLTLAGNLSTNYVNRVKFKGSTLYNSSNYQVSFTQDVFGTTDNTDYKFSVLRAAASANAAFLGNYASGIAWKGADTYGSLMVAYNTPSIRVAGGNGINAVWAVDLLHSGNYKTYVDKYYWANIKISTAANTNTTPTFNTCYTSDCFRSTGNSGWYSQNWGGGWYMSDSTWIRTYNSKSVYTGDGLIRTEREVQSASIRAVCNFRAVGGKYGFMIRNDGSNTYFLLTNSGDPWGSYNGLRPLYINNGNGYVYCTRLYGAVWNDYAEFRTSDVLEPGRCVVEAGDDSLILSTQRLQPGAEIVSDTYGFSIGQSESAKTPIAVSGRVLAYPYEDRKTFKPGDAVCSGPNGTVSRMTRLEIIKYPERIIGTVSAVPDYETWGNEKIKVNGRIWIRLK